MQAYSAYIIGFDATGADPDHHGVHGFSTNPGSAFNMRSGVLTDGSLMCGVAPPPKAAFCRFKALANGPFSLVVYGGGGNDPFNPVAPQFSLTVKDIT